MAQSNNKSGKKGKGKKEKKNKKGFENKKSGELTRSELTSKNESSELESVGESSNNSPNCGVGEIVERVVVDEEKGSVRKFVSFIGERIWGVWG